VNSSAKAVTLIAVNDETRDAVEKGRQVMKLLELHHKQQAELKKAREAIARRTADKVQRVLLGSSSASGDAATSRPADPTDSDTSAIDAAARIARDLPASIRRAIEVKLPSPLAEELDEAIYSFDALPTLAARDVQRVIHHADKRTLAIALLGAGEELFHTVTANMSSRAAAMLREDMESLLASGELKSRDVRDARAQLSSVIRTSVRAD